MQRRTNLIGYVRKWSGWYQTTQRLKSCLNSQEGPPVIDRSRSLTENIVKAMTGMWPEEYKNPEDREAWLKDARAAELTVEEWMKS